MEPVALAVVAAVPDVAAVALPVDAVAVAVSAAVAVAVAVADAVTCNSSFMDGESLRGTLPPFSSAAISTLCRFENHSGTRGRVGRTRLRSQCNPTVLG